MLSPTIKSILDFSDRQIFIAAHRGAYGVSVMENTLLSFETAIRRGADMVEVDLSKTKDGVLIGFHDDTLDRLYHRKELVTDCTYEELMRWPMYNYLQEEINPALNTWDEILAALKDRTTIILDKAWDIWDDALCAMHSHDMIGQVIFKYYLDDLASHHWALAHPEVLFIPMLRGEKASECEMARIIALKNNGNLVALEILPVDAQDPLLQPGFLSEMERNEIKIWCNSLALSKNYTFGGGFDDVLSLTKGGACGWGKLIEKGVSIIQTDFTLELRQYLDSLDRGLSDIRKG